MKGAERHKDNKPKVLAIHGAKSNSTVTKIQLNNLNITEEKYDITYVDGLITEGRGDQDIHNFVDGPFHSWYYETTDERFKESFLEAVVHVCEKILSEGPFNIIYGFSQGATIAAAVGAIHSHIEFRNFVLKWAKIDSQCSEEFLCKAPCDHMILGCASEDPSILSSKVFNFSMIENYVKISSFHLVGISDPFRPNSEKMSRFFYDARVNYMSDGHTISFMNSDSVVLKKLTESLCYGRNVISMHPPKLKKVSDITSIGVMSSCQLVGVQLANLVSCPTILEVLKSKRSSRPLLYNARDSYAEHCTTYGDVVNFIVGGAGDLRRLGVRPGEVVAFGAPPSGGATSALALLSIMAQTTAAPLAPSTTKADTLYFMEQYAPKHLILFHGIDNPGVEAAFKEFARDGRAALHYACIVDNQNKPGMFVYRSKFSLFSSFPGVVGESLSNPIEGNALLLGTSGTTSKPKIVQIGHGAIVQNGHILSRSLNLNDNDCCYSIMPLFHIGGISASILSSICAGSSICCDAETFTPEKMVDALALSNPQPTWYSSVPFIHKATVSYIKSMATEDAFSKYGICKNGVWETGHSLRFIRSGAAALLVQDASLLSSTFGHIPVIPTYSMSEQMPITHFFGEKLDTCSHESGNVGVPVATSLAIVDSENLTPLPFGVEGEIAICGPTVMKEYLNNEDANSTAFFELTLPLDSKHPFQRGRYMLTGDIGILNQEGHVTLKGRKKELIKKGGEQISLFEIEEILDGHPWIEISICFAVPSNLYGEEVGLALVITETAPSGISEEQVIQAIRDKFEEKDLPPYKWPTKYKIVKKDKLPKTKTNKYIRIGLAKILGFDEEDVYKNNAFIDWEVINGFRFVLACYVIFMHIGSNKSWGAFNNLRGWPWHVHVFFTLGGFSLAAPMNPKIKRKFKFFVARFMAMYPMYIVALIFVFVNLLVSCRPSTFRNTFHWDNQPNDLFIDADEKNGYTDLFCEGTPATPQSYWASLFLTLIVYLLGVPITPMWLLSWWMGYYFWYTAMYYQSLMVFPVVYNKLLTWRRNMKLLVISMALMQIINLFILIFSWFLFQNYSGYNHFDENGNMNNPKEFTDGKIGNFVVLGWYLFSPFWMIYFFLGILVAFLYDAYWPAECKHSHVWGYVADGCSILMLVWSIIIICQGTTYNHWILRPEAANSNTDVAIVNRLWDSICGRLVAPITTLWLFSLATGKGWTASIFRSTYLVHLSTHAYNCFLFHQPVAQWYYAATRPGLWWNWWQYRKTMYWFSPNPCPVNWFEYFFIIFLTVVFSALMNFAIQPLVEASISFLRRSIFQSDFDNEEIGNVLIRIIEDMTGITPKLDWTLDQCGLSSLGLPQLATRLNRAMSTDTKHSCISQRDLYDVKTVGDLHEILESNISQTSRTFKSSLDSILHT